MSRQTDDGAIPPFDGGKKLKFDQVRVGETAERGKGVFATKPLKARRAIGRVLGDVMPADHRSEYAIEFADGALEPAPPYRYLNHSCDPCAEFVEWSIGSGEYDEDGNEAVEYELWLHALRDIAEGEEITIDYGWDWESAIPCKCGSPNCRGWICRENELDVCIREKGAAAKSPS